jgi:hypothetical protein
MTESETLIDAFLLAPTCRIQQKWFLDGADEIIANS